MSVERKQGKRESPEELAKQETKSKAASDEPKKAAKSSKKAARKSAERPKAAAAKEKKQSKPTEKPKRRSPVRRRGAAEKPAASESRPVAQRPVVRARARYVRSSARKARLVITHIRGKSIEDARAVLRHSPRGVAEEVGKLLESAIANAENNHELVADDLLVKEVTADEGPTLRRFRPRAQGRATRIRKRTSHLSIASTTKD